MTEKERELLFICARICAEGRGQQGADILDRIDAIKEETKFVNDIIEKPI